MSLKSAHQIANALTLEKDSCRHRPSRHRVVNELDRHGLTWEIAEVHNYRE